VRDVREYEARTRRLAVWVELLVVLLLLEPARSIIVRWTRAARRRLQTPTEEAPPTRGFAEEGTPTRRTYPIRAPRQKGTQP
jgi:hypothetical protein